MNWIWKAERPKKLPVLFGLMWLVVLPHLSFGQGVHMTLRANTNPFHPPGRRYTGVVAEGNYAYVGQYAGFNGVLVFNVANPDAPVLVTTYAPKGINTLDIEYLQVSNGIGYFASGRGGGVQIVDLSDPTHPKLIRQLTSADGAYDNVENVFIDGDHLYIPNYRNVSPAVEIWNVSDPESPFLITTVIGTDPVASHDVTVINNRMYISGWSGHVDIWDVTDVDTEPPTLLGTFTSESHVQFSWPTSDGNYLVCPHELSTGSDVRIYDISDPANVIQAAVLSAPALGIAALTPAEAKIVNNLLYVAWDQAGLLVFDITDPTNPVMVGSYDTFPGAWNAGPFSGAWSVFPFLGQDRILYTDQKTGLYIFDATGVSSEPALYSMTASPAKVTGSKAATGQVFLVGLAQAGGFTINLSANGPVATNPVVVPEGATNVVFQEATSPVAANTPVVISATDGTYNASAGLTLLPPVPAKLTFSPSSIVGGNNSTMTVFLNAPAAVDTSVPVTVTSGQSAIASMPPVVVSAGNSSAAVTVATNPGSCCTSVKVSATLNGTTKTSTLTVK